MKVLVTLLCKNGVRIDSKRTAPAVEGDMNVAAARHEVLGRVCVEATLHGNTSPVPILKPLYDIALDSMSANGFRVRGNEIGPKGALVAQEWWCMPVHPPTAPSLS